MPVRWALKRAFPCSSDSSTAGSLCPQRGSPLRVGGSLLASLDPAAGKPPAGACMALLQSCHGVQLLKPESSRCFPAFGVVDGLNGMAGAVEIFIACGL